MALPIHIRVPLGGLGEKSFVEKVNGFNVITFTTNYASPLQLFLKRVVDILGGLVGSLVALLIMAIFGPKIKKLSPGPIIFKQERIGQNGKRFKVFKIRSMYMDAEERKKEFLAQNRISDGMIFKLDFDPSSSAMRFSQTAPGKPTSANSSTATASMSSRGFSMS